MKPFSNQTGRMLFDEEALDFVVEAMFSTEEEDKDTDTESEETSPDPSVNKDTINEKKEQSIPHS